MAAARDPFRFLPRGSELLRRVMLAELLGPPRSRQQYLGMTPLTAGGEPTPDDQTTPSGDPVPGGDPPPRAG